MLLTNIQVRHSLSNIGMVEMFGIGGKRSRQRRRAASPLGVVGSLAHWTFGLASEESYQELQVGGFPTNASFQNYEIARQVLTKVSCI